MRDDWVIRYVSRGATERHGTLLVPAHHWFVWTSAGAMYVGGMN